MILNSLLLSIFAASLQVAAKPLPQDADSENFGRQEDKSFF